MLLWYVYEYPLLVPFLNVLTHIAKHVLARSWPHKLNNDYCEACLGKGHFLCCDNCPRSFHFACLEPPLELDDVPKEDNWFCKACRAEKVCPGEFFFSRAYRRRRWGGTNSGSYGWNRYIDLLVLSSLQSSPPKTAKGIFGPLLNQLDLENPTSFKLPDDIRNFFKNGEHPIASFLPRTFLTDFTALFLPLTPVATGTLGEFVDSREARPLRAK